MNRLILELEQDEPFISLCTVTYNRRPFIKIAQKIIDEFDYDRNKIEWIIVDDGTDNIFDIVSNNSIVKYYRYEYKLPLGAKRNISNKLANGNLIIYIDDDDY